MAEEKFLALLNLQLISESKSLEFLIYLLELLLSMTLPKEVASKFKILKDATYSSIGLEKDDPVQSASKLFPEQKTDLTQEVAVFLRDLTKNVQKYDLRAVNSPFAEFTGNDAVELQSAFR